MSTERALETRCWGKRKKLFMKKVKKSQMELKAKITGYVVFVQAVYTQ